MKENSSALKSRDLEHILRSGENDGSYNASVIASALDLLDNAEPTRRGAEILDACCGGRMWWWDKKHPLAVYMDARELPTGTIEIRPNWNVAPDIVGDFRAMPFEDESFQMVVFDPPHIVRETPSESFLRQKYGELHPDTEQDDLRCGFAECWRVLAPGGTLIFKWAGDIKRVKPHFPATPIVGTRVPRGLQTWWLTFYKPLAA